MIGGHDMYVSLCRKHYNDGRIGEEGTRPAEDRCDKIGGET